MKTKLKFYKSDINSDLIGFVNRTDGFLRGVREDAQCAKKIVLLSEDIKNTIEEGTLYDCEVIEMKSRGGYVCIQATPTLFPATIHTIHRTGVAYKVIVSFGNKHIYFDPISGKTAASSTVDGAVKTLSDRTEILDKEDVVQKFKEEITRTLRLMKAEGLTTSMTAA